MPPGHAAFLAKIHHGKNFMNAPSKRKFTLSFLSLGLAIVLFMQFIGLNACTKDTARANNMTRKMRFTYAFTVTNIPAGASKVDVWVPAPQSDARQSISNLEVKCNYPYAFENETEYGNSILHVQATSIPAESLAVAMNFQVTRTGYHILQNKDKSSEENNAQLLQRSLIPDRLVPIDGKVADELKNVVREGMTPLEKARAIYDHVARTMTYDKSGTGWGRGDAIYACDVRKGNCTDFHSLFIGIARASRIPSRFVIGFPVPEGVTAGEIPGYHCWAEFYVEGMGWLPVDASEASKHREKWNDLFGGLDAHRVQFTVGRDIRVASMGDQAEPLNYFIYPQVWIDGKPHAEIQRHVRFAELAD
jgi:transglutaminase-like putative cysteine protease